MILRISIASSTRPHAEFLYHCVRRTIEKDLPEEAQFLRRYDAFRSRIQEIVDMPDRTIDLLFRFLHQNEGRLSKRAREKEFSLLANGEIGKVEGIDFDLFGSEDF
jgi:hypothetical protein